MFNGDFDPYDLLMQLLERMQRLENVHNNLAIAYEQSQHDLSQALHIIQSLQRRHMAVLQRLDALEREKMNATTNTNTNSQI